FLFMRRMAEVTNVNVLTREFRDVSDVEEMADPLALRWREVPEGVQVYEIHGPFFFGAAERFREQLSRFDKKPKVLVLRMRNVPAVDATGIHALRQVIERSRKEGTLVVLSGVHTQPLIALDRAGILDDLGEDNVCGNI